MHVPCSAEPEVTHFGAVLDMVTDRCVSTCLILALCIFYPHWLLLWQTLVALDISSHWIQMYKAVLCGEESHKNAYNPILKLYYSEVSHAFLWQ